MIRASLIVAIGGAFWGSAIAQITTVPSVSAGMSFQVPFGGVAATQTLSISTTNGPTTLVVGVPANQSWLKVSGNPAGTFFFPNSPATLSIQVTSSGLAALQVASANISIAIYGQPSTQINFPVTVAVGAPSILSANPATLAFTAVQGASVGYPASPSVTITSSGAQLTYTVSTSTQSGGVWLLVTSTAGVTGVSPIFQVVVNPSNLAAGVYSGTVLVQSQTTSDSVTIPVTLTVSAGSTNTYSVSVIPAPPGYTYTTMSGINDSGQVAGPAYLARFPSQAFIGSPSGSTAIPFLPGWTNTLAEAINDAGQIAGYGNNAAGGTQAFIATLSGSTAIPFVPGWSASQALAINNSGQVAGYGIPGAGGPTYQAFIGSPSGSSAIPLPPGGTYSIGAALNNLGQVAGTVNGSQAFIGNVSGSALIPLPVGCIDALAAAVNDSGQVAGTIVNGALTQAFIGTTAGSTTIPLPAGASGVSVSLGSLNNQGFVVGDSNPGGWIWSAASGTVLLTTLAPPGWNVTNALSISNNGIILAQASYNNDLGHYVELVPLPSAPGCSFSLTPASFNLNATASVNSITVTTQPGCSWVASSSDSWLTFTSGATGTGNGTVNFQVTANPGPRARAATVTIAGQMIPVAQIAPTPQPAGVSPASGNAATQTLTFTFTDPAGYSDFYVLDVLISTFLDGQTACYFAFAPTSATTGYLYLVDDAGDGGYAGPPMPLPSSGVVQNSQCSISGTGSSISASGTTLTLTLAVTFRPSFAGDKAVYMAARTNTQNSGWQALGTWYVPGPSPTGPSLFTMYPSEGLSPSGQAYTFIFEDTNGYPDLFVLDVLTNNFLDGVGACYFAYVPNSATDGYLYLVDDAGDGGYAPGSPILLSSGGILQNSQCAINTSGSAASNPNSNSLAISLWITFNPSFAGNRIFYAAARNRTTGNSGWQAMGSVTVP